MQYRKVRYYKKYSKKYWMGSDSRWTKEKVGSNVREW